MNKKNNVTERVKNAIIEASSNISEDKLTAFEHAIIKETNPNARWVLEQIIENCKLACDNRSPLCDDTGVPHLILEVGSGGHISGSLLADIHRGIEEGLRSLPGRPMAVPGNDLQRLDQSAGLSPDPSDVTAAPLLIVPGHHNTNHENSKHKKTNNKNSNQENPIHKSSIKLHILMLGSASTAIRANTGKVFHRHDLNTIINEIVSRATEAVGLLGCTPCTLGVGIGRSHYEATALTLLALAEGRYDVQSPLEKEITEKVNRCKTGALGLGGDTSVLGTFLKVGPQRASGVRVVSMQPCCCYDPRVATVELSHME